MFVEVFNDLNLKEVTIKLHGSKEIKAFKAILEHAAHDFKQFNLGAVASLHRASKMLAELDCALL